MAYDSPKYLVRAKAFHFGFDRPFYIQDAAGQNILFARMKAFKLKEDLRICHDEAMTREEILIKARKIIDFGTTYDIFDASSSQRIGSMRRKGLKSMLRDEWAILNFDDQEVGKIEEDSWVLAILRRALLSFLPQHYHATLGTELVARYTRHFNPFILKMTVEPLTSARAKLDVRMLLASGLLLAAIEGRQG